MVERPVPPHIPSPQFFTQRQLWRPVFGASAHEHLRVAVRTLGLPLPFCLPGGRAMVGIFPSQDREGSAVAAEWSITCIVPDLSKQALLMDIWLEAKFLLLPHTKK